MKIAIVGSRGVPPNYGGFETFAAELGTRLVARGHDVMVYCRSRNYSSGDGPTWRGIRRVTVPTPPGKHLETVVSTLLAMLHVAVTRRIDAVVLVNGINAFTAWLPRLVGIPVYINVDGIERQRDKWGAVASLAYRISEWLSTKLATGVISDAAVVADYYRDTYGAESTLIAYGAPVQRTPQPSVLKQWGLVPDAYTLYVSRLEPENNAHTVVQAYADVRTELPLVVVGDAPYAEDYKAQLRAQAARDARVRLLGAVYGEGYRALQEGATAYVQATSVGGTHPALVESMGAGNAIVANDTPEHREVLAGAGLYYSGVPQLTQQLQSVLDDAELRIRCRGLAQDEATARFSWESVTDAYERLLAR
jgi:glycosyltransferase involved in cell wall biosynthesis